jgi:glutathione S-transferase
MIVYGSSLSPFVRKTLAYAAEKRIDVVVKPVGLGSPEPEFVACSPFRKMPGFRDGDFTISDSTAIITYLEASSPIRSSYQGKQRAVREPFGMRSLSTPCSSPAWVRFFSTMWWRRGF